MDRIGSGSKYPANCKNALNITMNFVYLSIMITIVLFSVTCLRSLKDDIIPFEAEKLYLEGLKHGKRGEYYKALIFFNDAIKIQPKYSRAYVKRSKVLLQIPGQIEKARSDLTIAIKLNRWNSEAYLMRGNIYFKKGMFSLAVADYTNAIRINPKNAFAYGNRGTIYMAYLINKQQACTDLKRACELGVCRDFEMSKLKGLCK